MPLTTDDVQELIRNNDVLLRRMAELGIDAANVATALASRGVPAPEAFVQELAEVGRLFAAVRTEAFAAASSLALPLPPVETVNSAAGLKAMLGALLMSVDAAERQADVADARKSALNILNRIGLLTHADHAQFESLKICQEHASKLRALLEVQSADAPNVEAIAPFAALLNFIDSHQELDDEKWGELQETITRAFGASLAMAAGRGRLLTAVRPKT